MGDWHDLVEYNVAEPFFFVLVRGLVILHHVIHVFLVSQTVHDKKLAGCLLQLLVLFIVFKLNMEEAFKVFVQTFVLFDCELDLLKILGRVGIELEIKV
jgi:hypothetical protein